MNCPRCTSPDKVKSGFKSGRQRYKCKACAFFFTVAQKSDTATPAQRRLALTLYLEGLGFRSIGRIVGFSHVAVYQWVKAFGETVESIKRPAAQIVELDELHSYVRHKKYCWVWLAVDRLGKRFLAAVTGTRGVVTGARLWKTIKHPRIAQVMTDYWEPYEHFLPPTKHVQSKAETFTVEGYNSLFRHFLARFRRKTKCYSKSETMLRYSVHLVMAKWNGELKDILI
ncbi:IS1 family transposase [Candidatus Nitrospira salsa]